MALELRGLTNRSGGPDASSPQPAVHQGFRRFEIADTTSHPNRAHGKVFFTLPGEGDFTCSGTVVTSNSHSVVLTAGHCVHHGGPGGGFATRWMFVPGYREGSRPFGEWPATRLASTTGWIGSGNFSLDVGAALVARNGNGQGIEDVVGARGIEFNRTRDQLYRAYGYPSQQPPLEFDGEHLFACDSSYGGDDDTRSPPEPMVIGCDMNAGSSGGSWVVDGAVVNSVSSYKYLLEPDHIYGPYFGVVAEDLYDEVSGEPILCRGRAVTHLGGTGVDSITGTDGADVFKTGTGSDSITAAGSGDRACGGRGRDTVLAGDGNDLVSAGRGRDTLGGGPGRDRCSGGRGRDKATGCERKKRVP